MSNRLTHERPTRVIESRANAITTRPFGLIELFIRTLDDALRGAIALFHESRSQADRDLDAVRLKDERIVGDLLTQRFSKRDGSTERRLGQNDRKLFTAVPSKHFVATNASLDDTRHFLEHVITGEMAVYVVDAFEVVDVEHQNTQLAFVPSAANEFSFESFVQVALVVDLRETIDDGHAINFFVILRFDVGAREVLEDRRTNFHAVAVFQDNLARDLFVVAVRAVGAAIINDDPRIAVLSELRMSARYAVAIEDDLVVATSADACRTVVEDEAFTQERWLLGVNDDETIRRVLRRKTFGSRGLYDLRNASFFVEVVHACSARCACVMDRILEHSRLTLRTISGP